MPLPRSLLRPVVPEDRDLRVVRGAMPEGISGECFLAAPHPSTLGPPHAFFGAGMSYVCPSSPACAAPPPEPTRGAIPGSTPRALALQHKRPERLPAHHARRAVAVRSRQRGEHRTAAVGRPALHDLGRRPAGRDRPGVVAVPRRGRERSEWQVFELMPGPVLPMITSTAHPVIDPDRDCLWTVNTYFGQLQIVRWDGDGPIRRWPIAGAVIPQSVHTITQTRELARRRRLRVQGRAPGDDGRRPQRAEQPGRADLPDPQGRPRGRGAGHGGACPARTGSRRR